MFKISAVCVLSLSSGITSHPSKSKVGTITKKSKAAAIDIKESFSVAEEGAGRFVQFVALFEDLKKDGSEWPTTRHDYWNKAAAFVLQGLDFEVYK